jgi:hypothetical protein
MKYNIVCLSVVALIGLAAGQSSKTRTSSAKSGSDSSKDRNQALDSEICHAVSAQASGRSAKADNE